MYWPQLMIILMKRLIKTIFCIFFFFFTVCIHYLPSRFSTVLPVQCARAGLGFVGQDVWLGIG